MSEIMRGVVYLRHPRERSAWEIIFLHSEIDNCVRSMELAGKKKKKRFLINRKTNSYVGGIEN